jgi:hypothetical protein
MTALRECLCRNLHFTRSCHGRFYFLGVALNITIRRDDVPHIRGFQGDIQVMVLFHQIVDLKVHFPASFGGTLCQIPLQPAHLGAIAETNTAILFAAGGARSLLKKRPDQHKS